METLYSTLSNARDQLVNSATTTLTWTEYKASAPTGPSRVELRQSDFQGGTLRITHGNCVFVLMENISIEPGNAPEFSPAAPTAEYPWPPYQLGWFAAITVETTDPVVIDLNGKILKQSKLFHLQQRFYALIELGDQPFLSGQGPSEFGPFTGCSNVTIQNGVLDRSSHHGIHSAGEAQNILLENLVVQNFEVAGIHLNGSKKTVIKNCTVGPTLRDVPVTGIYSQLRFIRSWLPQDGPHLEFKYKPIGLGKIKNDIDSVLAQVFQTVKNGDGHIPQWLSNTSNNLPVGSAYGIVVNKKGVAVNGFLTQVPADEDMASEIYIDSVVVQGIESHTLEIVGLAGNGLGGAYGGGGSIQTGPVGDVFRIEDNQTAEGVYTGNALSNAQLWIAVSATSKGTTSITSKTLDWALSGTPTKGVIPLSSTSLYKIYDGDSMAHVTKGNIGLWIQGAKTVGVSNLRIGGVIQIGAGGRGATTDYPSPNHTSHPGQSLPWYGGATSRGIAVASCIQVDLSQVNVNKVKSANSQALGIDFIGNCSNLSTTNVCVEETSKGVKETTQSTPVTPIVLQCPMRLRDANQIQSSGMCPASLKF